MHGLNSEDLKEHLSVRLDKNSHFPCGDCGCVAAASLLTFSDTESQRLNTKFKNTMGTLQSICRVTTKPVFGFSDYM